MLPHRQRLQQQSGMAAEDGAEGEEQQRRRRSKGPGRHELPHRALVDAARLPAEVSWRGTGADSMGPKDQATCGSCWWVVEWVGGGCGWVGGGSMKGRRRAGAAGVLQGV